MHYHSDNMMNAPRPYPFFASLVLVFGLPTEKSKVLRFAEILKPRPLISEKLAFGCALFSNVESRTAMIQKTIIASFATCCCTSYKEYVAHKMASTGTYLSRLPIRDSVDSLCRDGADAQYMQYLNKTAKSRITSPQTR